ncbi:MAG: sensor histidine kinase [Candidatus Thorarchaeota archaeon]
MNVQKRRLLKVFIFVPLSMIAAFVAISILGIVSHTSITRVGVHSLLSYWAAIPAALSVMAIRKRISLSLTLFTSAILFSMFVNIGSAISYLLDIIEVSSATQLQYAVADGLELTIIALFLLLAIRLRSKVIEKRAMLRWSSLAIVLLLVLLVSYGIVWFLLMPVLSQGVLTMFGLVASILGIVTLIVTVYTLAKDKHEHLPVDSGYLITVCILLLMSLVLLITDLLTTTSNWIYAENIQIASLFVLGLSLGVPFLRKAGFNRVRAYSYVIGFAILTYLPFAITISIEAGTLEFLIAPMNELAFSIIHIGVGFLSAMMGILLLMYSMRRPSRNLYPLVLLFGLWAGVAIISIFATIVPEFSPVGQPIVPYMVGSLLSLPLLYYAIRWSAPNEIEKPMSRPILKLVFGGLALTAIVVIGEMLNQLFLQAYSHYAESPMGNSLLLGTNLVLILAYAYLFYFFAELSEGRTSVQVYVVFVLSTWIIPNVLKSYYMNWTPGWWTSEILIFIGLLIGPALLGLLYIRAMHETEESHDRANLYADLLMHDVSNYHQMLLTALELLGADTILDDQRKRLSNDARQVILLAGQLIANVRLLGKTEQRFIQALRPLNLLSILVEALDDVMEGLRDDEVKLQFDPKRSEALVMAQESLKYVFVNLLYIAIQGPKGEKTLFVEVDHHPHLGDMWWRVRLGVLGKQVDSEQLSQLRSRAEDTYSGTALGFLVARVITETLGGVVTIEDDVEEPDKGTLFVVALPQLDESKE